MTAPGITATYDYLDRIVSLTDAAGMRSFSYNANNQLGNETNPSIMNGMITYTYDNAGRRSGMNLSNEIDSFAQVNYTYDTRGRIATVGNNTDTLTYTYVPGTNMIGSAAWQNASINTVNTYDQYKRLTNIAVNGENVYGYTLNDKNQRTSATLPDGNKWNYTYDVMGQLTGAAKQDTANNPLTNKNYFYDLIGNRTSATENSATTTYASNLVNQYTAVNAVVPFYDLDGNMTSYNGWNYTYNGENRLIVAENVATGVRVEADYDYMGRRIFKKVYNNNTLTKHSVFVYDEFKQIAEFDALNNNTLRASYLWQPVGLDVVLLRNNEYLVADGNKNIIQVRNAAGSVTDSYVYDPFGKVTHTGSSENAYQFSSEFFDSETELVYYNYRYYMPNLGRWINRDPIEEQGGVNLYMMVKNNSLMFFDLLGHETLYNVDNLPELANIASAKGWNTLSDLFNRWFSGPRFSITDGTKVGTSDPYNDNIVSMDWVLSFPRAQEVYKKYLTKDGVVTNKFKKLLKDKFQGLQKITKFGADAFATPDPRIRHSYQWQFFSVPTNHIEMDALDAALHEFHLAGIFEGTYFPGPQAVCFKKVGIYVKDQFGFYENQYLGNWKKPSGVKWLPWGTRYLYGNSVYNSLFREYQTKYNKGEDFFVFSDMKIEFYTPNMIVWIK